MCAQWNGKLANKDEKFKAGTFLQALRVCLLKRFEILMVIVLQSFSLSETASPTSKPLVRHNHDDIRIKTTSLILLLDEHDTPQSHKFYTTLSEDPLEEEEVSVVCTWDNLVIL